jgi:hypothetical protein
MEQQQPTATQEHQEQLDLLVRLETQELLAIKETRLLEILI